MHQKRRHHGRCRGHHILGMTSMPNSANIVDISQGQGLTSCDKDMKRSLLGLRPDVPILEEDDLNERSKFLWSRIRSTLREPFAEFWGVVIMIMFGDGSVAQVLLSTGQTTAPGGNGFGAWGLGVMLGIYVAGDSGAYLNPAVTFCNCLYRQLPWRRFPVYFIAQVLGGYVGSGIVYANYISAIDWYEGHGIRTVPPAPKATAGIFCTYPQAFVTKASQFFSEFIASALLMFVIFALKDRGNNGVPRSDKWFPLCLFFLIFGLGACFGWETGYAINLARDFGPRLMSYTVGYGPEVWSAGDYYFWIPMVAPFLGCAFGGFLYDVFIYTGPSPINTPWLGFKQIVRPQYTKEVILEHRRRNKENDIV
ncbi:aquaporin [Aaosphaeria arxii CBS 175.79]|uniref:Aquaporin n=1 Tax=Aaosphaeria arxii CBS 175.79 TaxID=1450172 RepID=A0A6A5Y866_9PLEO|nr:aquaporin [Aaosphaeria arxii CBS 175.79]KAF2020754.1 aquaporin [Aaosphaeria arxii CBS 175.79]